MAIYIDEREAEHIDDTLDKVTRIIEGHLRTQHAEKMRVLDRIEEVMNNREEYEDEQR